MVSELDSNDRVRAREGELSGGELLRQRYGGSVRDPRGDGADPTEQQDESDDERAPPGTVPQSAQTSKQIPFLGRTRLANSPLKHGRLWNGCDATTLSAIYPTLTVCAEFFYYRSF